MDPELKAYLDGMFQNLSQQIARSRQENQETRQDLTQQIAESRQYAEHLNQQTRQDLTQQIAESRQHAEHLNQGTRQDLIDHMDRRINETYVLIEDVRHEVQLLAEGIITVRDQLGRVLTDHEERITRLEQGGVR